MVSKCANPDCEKQLHYLREGRVYLIETFANATETHSEHFWLCGACARIMLLEPNGADGVRVVRRPMRARQAMPPPIPHGIPA